MGKKDFLINIFRMISSVYLIHAAYCMTDILFYVLSPIDLRSK